VATAKAVVDQLPERMQRGEKAARIKSELPRDTQWVAFLLLEHPEEAVLATVLARSDPGFRLLEL
jgi:hypothetical protein